MGRGDPWTHHKMHKRQPTRSLHCFLHFMVCPGVTTPHFIEKDLLSQDVPTIIFEQSTVCNCVAWLYEPWKSTFVSWNMACAQFKCSSPGYEHPGVHVWSQAATLEPLSQADCWLASERVAYRVLNSTWLWTSGTWSQTNLKWSGMIGSSMGPKKKINDLCFRLLKVGFP